MYLCVISPCYYLSSGHALPVKTYSHQAVVKSLSIHFIRPHPHIFGVFVPSVTDSDHFEVEAAPADRCTYHTRGLLVRIVGEGTWPVITAGVRLLFCLAPVSSLQIQSLRHLTPAGRCDLTSRVTTRTVTGTGFNPLPALGVFPHGMCLSRHLAGLPITRVTHLGVWLPLLSCIRPKPPHSAPQWGTAD